MINASPQRRKERRELLWTQMNTDGHGSPLEIRGRRLREKEMSKPHLHFERVVKICGDLCPNILCVLGASARDPENPFHPVKPNKFLRWDPQDRDVDRYEKFW